MKIQAIIDLDLDTGDYEIQFKNVSQPGASMDYHRAAHALRKVFKDADAKITKGQEPINKEELPN